MKATATPIRELPAQEYQCSRCGGIRVCKSNRQRPEMCADCQYVLSYREPTPDAPSDVQEFTRDEQLAGRRAYYAGQRDPETVARYRAYERARNRKGRSA